MPRTQLHSPLLKRTKVFVDIPIKATRRLENVMIKEQTNAVVNYAQRTINKALETVSYTHRTNNLAASYVAIVFFNGAQVGNPLFPTSAPSQTKAVGKTASEEMWKGRDVANAFASNYKPKNKNGWEVCFATTAYYGAYLHQGIKNIGGGRTQFRVISGIYRSVVLNFGKGARALEVNTYTY